MLAGLIQNYVQAINSGIVPNIQNAWSYICQNECQKAMEKSLKTFDEELLETFSLKAPMFEEELWEVYKEAKKTATDMFTSTCIGDDSTQFL